MREPVERTATIPLGVVIRKQPGVTRWARWVWRVSGVLPGAPPAEWRELRREGEAIEYHAATLPLELHRAETEGYRVALSNEPPTLYVLMRETEPGAPWPLQVFGISASAFDAEAYLESGEDIVEAVPMPPAVIAWLSDFVARHHKEEPFVKRKRRPGGAADPACQAGPKVRQPGDVYAAPAPGRRGEKPQ